MKHKNKNFTKALGLKATTLLLGSALVLTSCGKKGGGDDTTKNQGAKKDAKTTAAAPGAKAGTQPVTIATHPLLPQNQASLLAKAAEGFAKAAGYVDDHNSTKVNSGDLKDKLKNRAFTNPNPAATLKTKAELKIELQKMQERAKGAVGVFLSDIKGLSDLEHYCFVIQALLKCVEDLVDATKNPQNYSHTNIENILQKFQDAEYDQSDFDASSGFKPSGSKGKHVKENDKFKHARENFVENINLALISYETFTGYTGRTTATAAPAAKAATP